MHFERQLSKTIKKSKKSVLLLGPRQTGKSTLIKDLEPALTIDLSDQQVFLDHLKDPGLIKKKLGSSKTVFVDEVQRIPSLLNTIQSLIDKDSSLKFYLSGSSARRLRRGQANLLPGRVHVYQLGPLSLSELGANADLDKLLSTGALPGVYLEEVSSARKTLRAYAATYLKEEIQAESLTRNLEGFSRFFDLVASRSGDFIDFAKFSSLAQIERTAARRYFDILTDTMVIYALDSFAKSGRTRLVQHPRFYFFDVGVLNGCLGNFDPSSDRRGTLFEHLCLQMIISELKAHDEDHRISVYRTESGAEVDFILETQGRTLAIEVKATRTLGSHDLRGLKSFSDYYGKKHGAFIFYLGEERLHFDKVVALPLSKGIESLF